MSEPAAEQLTEFLTSRVDPAIRLYVEDRVADTRHSARAELKEALDRLEKVHHEASEKATREHGEVRRDLSTLSVQVAQLASSVSTVTPLLAEVETLKEHGIETSAVSRERDRRNAERRADRRYMIGSMLGVATLIVTAVELIPH